MRAHLNGPQYSDHSWSDRYVLDHLGLPPGWPDLVPAGDPPEYQQRVLEEVGYWTSPEKLAWIRAEKERRAKYLVGPSGPNSKPVPGKVGLAAMEFSSGDDDDEDYTDDHAAMDEAQLAADDMLLDGL